jgi:hypothetical protein
MRADPHKKTPPKTKRFSQQRTAAPEKGLCREEKKPDNGKRTSREKRNKPDTRSAFLCGARRQNEEDDNSGTVFVDYGRIGHTPVRNV